jgi:hypothetical protein
MNAGPSIGFGAAIRRPRRAAEATIVLPSRLSSLMAFESFVNVLGFLSAPERRSVTIAGGEILDNIVKHAYPVDDDRIALRVARRREGGPVLLGFYFRSPAFAAFAARGEARGDARAADGERLPFAREPLFDPDKRRWRGIGLVMCRNLSRRVSFRPGESMDRIYLEFGGS